MQIAVDSLLCAYGVVERRCTRAIDQVGTVEDFPSAAAVDGAVTWWMSLRGHGNRGQSRVDCLYLPSRIPLGVLACGQLRATPANIRDAAARRPLGNVIGLVVGVRVYSPL